MNSQLQDFLNTDLQFIKGVGPVLAARFADLLGGRRVLDFMLHIPYYVKPRGISNLVSDAKPGDVLTVPVQIMSCKKGGRFRSGRKSPTQIICHDKSGEQLILQFFNSNFLDYWIAKLPIGEWRIVSGKLDPHAKRPTMSHPDFIEKIEDKHKIPERQAIYPISAGLTQRIMTNVRDAIFTKLELIEFDSEYINEFFKSLRAVHYPDSNEDLGPMAKDMVNLAGAEALAHQVAIAITRVRRKNGVPGRVIKGDGHFREMLYKSLPFKLTAAQNKTIEEIETDMAQAEPMMRLVQGDVGSGKTMVALAAALNAAECKYQTALMAPTDTLAGQHFAKIRPVCDELGIHCDILTGRDKGKDRREKLISIKSGRTKIIIGTHALFQQDVEYKDLALVIIDEQHRFGVAQRAALSAKGDNPDFLALSATPIPRTLSMTVYGDMDISIINEKPVGRLPIKTTTLAKNRIMALIERIRVQVSDGAKVFWVCPLVTESEEHNAVAAEERFKFLSEHFDTGSVGLVHGQMDKKDRDKVMAEFSAPDGKVKLLVATSVIEVGIDVPAATIMIIENAERFGLSALHQLRGRVGRGSQQSFCILLHGYGLSEDGQKRLSVLCESDDGFLIAEQDLMMRGSGELLGTKQSGWIPYYFVDWREHRDVFKLAQRRALEISESDSNLCTAKNQYIRDLLFIFDREINIQS